MPNEGESTNRRVLERLPWLVCTCLFLFLYCQNVEEATIENLREQRKLTDYQMISLTGRRDGDRLPVRVVFKASSSNLLMDLRFRIGVPTRLESGQYYWERHDEILEGGVRARSVTFLGGQSDNPNLGGVFELLSTGSAPIYKVTLPTTEVRPSDPETPWVVPSH
ncbi:MAG: hypothetical protein ACE5MK_12390 [Acidobacteriota bacterium]